MSSGNGYYIMIPAGDKYKTAFFKWLEDEAFHKKHETFNDECWIFIPVKVFRQQGRGNECGIYTTMAFNFHTDDLAVTFTQKAMEYFRLHLANVILRGILNY